MKKHCKILVALHLLAMQLCAQTPVSPDKLYGRLFHDVQMARLFPDSKTFADCSPRKAPAEIVAAYNKIMANPAIRFSLKLFVEENFILPLTPQLTYITKEKDIEQHINNIWGLLRRPADSASNTGSLLPLPYPYMVPGGRSREMYYTDSYYMMLGAAQHGEELLLEDMVKNFAYLIDSFGYIPTGNRSYYLGRSQAPVFALMVDMLATLKGDSAYSTYLPQLEKEYNYWMQGSAKLAPMHAAKNCVRLRDGSILNRYWDEQDTPRPEAYYEDVSLTARLSAPAAKRVYRELRAASTSGWNGSSRWLTDKKNPGSLQVTQLIPVDLNCLLYQLELVIAKGKLLQRDDAAVAAFRQKASLRLAAIDKYCWNKRLNFYTDYNFVQNRQSAVITAAGIYPFCFFDQKPDYMSLLARKAGDVVKTSLLKEGGIQASTITGTQPWDAPNGWPALQWMMVWGLHRCGQKELARTIIKKWIDLNRNVFERTGRLMTAYNVADVQAPAVGMDDSLQAAVGATGGVYLQLLKMIGKQ
ncbi:MAG TPA: trehalase family glycosidase [Chitinophagaceae bacterium]|nr:trehalase family glycosidase [Chitinophagaceae bacterium]